MFSSTDRHERPYVTLPRSIYSLSGWLPLWTSSCTLLWAFKLHVNRRIKSAPGLPTYTKPSLRSQKKKGRKLSLGWYPFFSESESDVTPDIQPKCAQITNHFFIVTSPQHKCLGEWNSYERAPDSAKKKQQQQFTYGQTVQKNNKQFTDGQTVQKNNNDLHMDRQCKKNKQFTYGQTVQKNNKQFTYGQTVQKSCTGAFTVLQTVRKNNSNLHMDSTYLQTIQKTMCKIHIHILSTHSVL